MLAVPPNRKNGKVSKTVKTGDGQIELITSRDRNGSFEPEIVRKRETILADSLQDRIIGMYGIGMSLRNISSHIKEMYDMDISHDTLSSITERIMPLIKEWQSRPLDELYCIVWMDAIHYKVKEQGKVKSRAVYNILGINSEGRKDLLGVYVSENEGANFWLGVLTDLNNRGIKQLAIWYNEVEDSGIDAFKTVSRSVQTHYESILNFFDNRSTNASAESFNAKIKAFRATSRGVRDTSFFLFRLANLYA